MLKTLKWFQFACGLLLISFVVCSQSWAAFIFIPDWDSCELEDTTVLHLNQQTFGKLEKSLTRDHYTFFAAANQKVSLNVIGNPGNSIYFDLIGPNDWAGFSKITADSALFTLPETGTYTLIAYKPSGIDTSSLYSFKLNETALTNLALEVPYNGILAGNNYFHLFKIEIEVSESLSLNLDDASVNNTNELYLKFGTPPTRGNFDYQAVSFSNSDKKIDVPMANTGTWYALLYCANIVENSNYSITAKQSSVIISSITPEKLGNTADSVITITGSGFDPDTQVFMVDADGIQYPASLIEMDSFNQITIIFDQGSIPVGQYSIVVVHSDGNFDRLEAAFEMLQGGSAKLETKIIAPSRIGNRMAATIYVEYENTGDVAMPAPLMVVSSVEDRRNHAILKLGDTVPARGFWTSSMPEGFSNTVQFLASGKVPGIIQPGESMRIPVQYAGMQKPWSNFSIVTFTLGVLDAGNGEIVDWDSQKTEMKPKGLTDEAWEPVWLNFKLRVGSTWGDYVKILSENAVYLGRLGHNITDINKLLSFELEQCNALNNVKSLSSSIDAYVETVGTDIVFNRFYPQRLSNRYISGPFGYGWTHNWDIRYEIDVDGTVNIIGPAEKRRIFQPDIRPGRGYFAMEGDDGTLSNHGSGIFSLKESNGLIRMYQSDGRLDYIEDTNGNRITAEYTGDMLTSLEHSSGKILQISYTSDSKIDAVEDSDGRITLYNYDVGGEYLSLVTYFDNSSVKYKYFTESDVAKEHALSEIEHIGESHQYFTYDSEGRLDSAYLEDGTEEYNFSYNDTGMVSVADAFGNTHKFYFDHNSLIAKYTDPKEYITSFKYDENHNLLEAINPAGHSQGYGYDKNGNVISIKNQIGLVNFFENKGPYHELSKINDAKNNTVDYGYSTSGNLTSITYTSGDIENWTYDVEGTVSSWTNCRGEKAGYIHDSDGKLTEIQYPDGSQIDYAYSTRGNLISATDDNGEIVLQYYPNDRLQKITYPDGKYLEYIYNLTGLRTSVTDHLGHIQNYSYNDAGKLESITDENSLEIVRYEYNIGGRLAKSTMANGIYSVFTYDAAMQLKALINYAPDNSELSKYIYTYDSRGRRTFMTTKDGIWTYKYDDSGQLIEYTSPYGHTVSYVYDAVGNRISVTDNGVTKDYTTNDMNQYLQVGNINYEYDTDGNMISKIDTDGTTTYVYDIHNRLIQVVTPTDGTWEYTYDALGNRNSVSHDGNVTHYVNDPFGMVNIAAEYDGSGDLVKRYIHGLGLTAQIDGAGDQAYYAFDGNGNTGQVTGTGGAVLNSYVYSPFGVTLQEDETVSNVFKYVGQFGVMDTGNGLTFMRARYYSGEIGRFVAKDPIGINANDVNFYRYCENEPVALIDPNGELAFTLPTITLAFLVKKIGLSVAIGMLISKSPLFQLDAEEGELPPPLPPPPTTPRPIITPFGFIPPPPVQPTEPVILPPPVPPTEPGGEGKSNNVGSWDPNEKIGPTGYGAAGYISDDTLMPYRVNFENESEATAPAQIVFVTDQLDEDLDWSTFELTEIGFGDERIPIPQGTRYFEKNIPFSFNGVDFEVQIQAGIDLSSGEAYAYFYSIDPDTSMPPSVDIGFLPPENDTGRGQGYFSYIIRPQKDLLNGTEIRNVGIIQFDFQETISTNQIDPHDPTQGTDPDKECLNTIYTGVPFPTSVPEISDGAMDVPVLSTLKWSQAEFADSYDLYLWESGQPKPSTPTASGLNSTSYTPVLLLNGKTYFWQLIAKNVTGETQGPEWHFTTAVVLLAPIANDDDYTVDEDVTIGILSPEIDGILANDIDDNGDILTAVLISEPEHGTLDLQSDGSFSYSPSLNFNGNDSFTYVANDGHIDSNTATVTIRVNPVDDPPVVDAGSDKANLPLGEIQLNGTATDIDGKFSLTPHWQIITEPYDGAGELLDTGTLTPKLIINGFGSYEIELEVCDNNSPDRVCSYDTVIIATQGNVKPTAVITGNSNVDQYSEVCLSADDSTDPNAGDIIESYYWGVTSPNGTPYELNSYNEVNVCFNVDQPGNYTAKLIVSDGQLEGDIAEFLVNVGENGIPFAVIEIESGSPIIDVEEEICLDGSSSYDPEYDFLTYKWNIIVVPDGSLLSQINFELEQACFTPDIAGNYVIQLIVTDEHQKQSTPQTITIIAEVGSKLPGDLDGDGDIDRNDVLMINYYRNQPSSVCPECDIDGDGTITVLDARKLMRMCTCPRCMCR